MELQKTQPSIEVLFVIFQYRVAQQYESCSPFMLQHNIYYTDNSFRIEQDKIKHNNRLYTVIYIQYIYT